MIAGGNAGIGRAAAQGLAGLGATVHILCRSKEKGEKAVQEIKVSHFINQPLDQSVIPSASQLIIIPIYLPTYPDADIYPFCAFGVFIHRVQQAILKSTYMS